LALTPECFSDQSITRLRATRKSGLVSPPAAASRHVGFSLLSTSGNRPKSDLWQVDLHPSVAKVVAAHAEDKRFRPTIRAVIANLELDPKAYGEKKSGKLEGCRAVRLRFAGTAWRLVYAVNEDEHSVYIVALDSHDRAYAQAARRPR
jgi:mRNA-degrading endonuclease RelE of RelBE toxin-antitoxin system